MTVEFAEQVVTRPDRLSDGTPCFVAEDPGLPGCVGYGVTQEEAKEQLAAARGVYLRPRTINRPTLRLEPSWTSQTYTA